VIFLVKLSLAGNFSCAGQFPVYMGVVVLLRVTVKKRRVMEDSTRSIFCLDSVIPAIKVRRNARDRYELWGLSSVADGVASYKEHLFFSEDENDDVEYEEVEWCDRSSGRVKIRALNGEIEMSDDSTAIFGNAEIILIEHPRPPAVKMETRWTSRWYESEKRCELTLDYIDKTSSYGAEWESIEEMEFRGAFSNPHFLIDYQMSNAWEYSPRKEDIVRYAVSRGIDVNIADDLGRTALSQASAFGRSDLVGWLLEIGAKVNDGEDGVSLSLYAACNGWHVDIARLLIARGARVDAACFINALDIADKEGANEADLIELFHVLLANVVDVNIVDGHGHNILMDVVSSSGIVPDRELVSLLLDRGIDLDAVDVAGKTALMHALESQNFSIASYLVECGSRVESVCLLSALKCGSSAGDSRVQLELCYLLLGAGVDVNVVDSNGQNGLMYIVSYYRSSAESFDNQRELVSLLLESGIDINAIDIAGKTALMYALKEKNIRIAAYLIDRGARVDDSCLISALQLSIHYERGGYIWMSQGVFGDQLEIYRKLLECGIDVNVVDSDGMNGLMHAVSCYGSSDGFCEKQRELVSFLLDRGIDLNAVDIKGKTALVHALEARNLSLASYLIERGARVDAGCLMFVPEESASDLRFHIAACRLLLGAGVDVNVVDSNGKNILMHVVSIDEEEDEEEGGEDFISTQRELVSFLLDSGININAVDLSGKTALLHALKKRNFPIALYLIACGARTDSVSLMSVLQGGRYDLSDQLEWCRGLLSSGVEVDMSVVDSHGMSSLMRVVSGEYPPILFSPCNNENRARAYRERLIDRQRELVSLLLDNGIDINAVDISGRTALLYAIEARNSSIASYLIERGAHVDIECFKKAVEENFADRTELCRKLLSAGSDVNVVDSEGTNILMHAIRSFCYYEGEELEKYHELLSLILSYGIDLTAVDSEGKTALMHALDAEWWDDTSIVSCLIEHGACINIEYIRRVYGVAVDAASEVDRIKMYRRLLSAGVDVKIRDTTGMNGLMQVVSSNVSDYEKRIVAQRELVLDLLSCGIGINAVDSEGKTALKYALDNRNYRIASYLINCGVSVDAECLILLFRGGCRTSDDCRIQHELCSKLLSSGVDVNVTDSDGKTALMHVSSSSESAEFAECDYCSLDDDDHTKPSGYTEEYLSSQRKLADLLISSGASLSAVDNSGHSAISHAISVGNTVLSSYLTSLLPSSS
jgi:ankyrin repeat protein